MSTTSTDKNSGKKKPFVPLKPSSPFSNDPHNNRGGKGGNKSGAKIGGAAQKMKSISVPKFKGGSGGDR